MSPTPPPVTVLVIDDSAHNRRAIAQMLGDARDVQVVDRASDGEEGLRKAAELRPDVITLDLEMPKLDGFAFLRLLMATVPTPVIVVSSYAHKADVFKALELGAFDFIAKPARADKGDLAAMRAELLEKVRAVRLIRPSPKKREPAAKAQQRIAATPAACVIAVGASTGGPPAIQRLIESLAPEPSICLLICQHMPPRFTKAFADRLDRIGAFSVSEARDGDPIRGGRAYIAPGGRHMVLTHRGGGLELRTPLPLPGDKYVPSIDRLFESVANALAGLSLGVILTGMGADGAAGAMALNRAGGEVWAEAEETAVIYGMPKEAVSTGAVKRVLPLPEIGPQLVALARKRR